MKNNFLYFYSSLAIIVFFVNAHFSFGQASAVYQAAYNFGRVAEDVAVDGNGNMYVTGSFSGTVDFDPGAGTVSQVSAGGLDIFILKLSPTGALLWAHRFGSTGDDIGKSIDVDASGNVYTTGVFQFTVDFDPGATVVSRAGRIFTQKLDTNGNLVWISVTSGTNAQTEAIGIIDNLGNVYRAGHFTDNVDFDPDPISVISLTSLGTRDIFVEKLDANGALVWVKRIGSAGANNYSYALTLDPSNNVLITGYFSNSLDFDPDAGSVTLVAVGGSDAYLLKLDGITGGFNWVKQISGNNFEGGLAVVNNASGDIFLAGTFNGTVDFDPGAATFTISTAGSETIFVERFDPNGNFVWAKTMEGTSQNEVEGIVLDGAGAIYLTGEFQNSVDFDPNAPTSIITAAGARDGFLQKLNANGALVYAYKIGNTGDQSARGLTYSNNNIYVTGYFTGTVDFDPSAATANLTADAVITVSGFLLKMSNSPLSITIDPQPQGGSVCTGGDTSLTLAVSGTTNITYQWQKFNTTLASFDNVINSANYSGATSNTLTVTAATSSLAGDYRCAIAGDFVSTTFSNTVALTVPALPPAPTTTPIVSDGCGVQTYNLTATSATAGEFRWYDVATRGVPQEINTTGNFTTPSLSASATYYATFFNGACESSRTPSAITVSLNGPGVLDKSFVPQPTPDGFFSTVDDIFIQPDNKIVVNAFAVAPDEFYVTRLLPDGTIDPGFQLWNQTQFNGYVDLVELQADGKILIAGRFSEINITNYGYIARLNSDGTLDGSFNSTAPGFNNFVRAMAIQPDGKIIVGGEFTSYNGTAVNRIVRINPNGAVDGTFTVGSGTDGSVGEVVIQADGKILISGNFSTYNSLPANGMARLNTNGSLDNSFNGVFSQVSAIALQADQKILIGGTFIQVGGVSRNYLARLNVDGSLDLTFDPGTGFDDTVYSIYVDPSSKILVGGWFQNVNGEVRNFLARLYPDGSVDKFFNPGVGPNSSDIYSIVPYGTNKIIAGGYFDRWNGQLQNGLGVINNECIRTPLGFDNTTCTNSITISACGGSNGQYRWYTDAVTATPIAGETNSTLSITNFSATTTYYVTLKDAVCESARVAVTATLTTLPSPSVPPSSVCGSGTITLNASGGTSGQYRWYTVATGGTAITAEVNSSYTTPLLTSTTTYYVSINNGTCESARTSVIATINPIPTAPTTTGASGCSPSAIILNASGGTNGQYRWYTVATGGTAITGQTNSSYTTPSLTTTTTYFVSIDNGTCESIRTPVISTINPTPAAPTVTGVLVCSGTTITLNASGGAAGQYRWYTVATGGIALAGEVNDSYATPVINATTTYYVAINNGTCESTRTSVTATINPLPSAPTTTGATACNPSTATLNASGGASGQYRWYTVPTGGTAISGQTNSSFTTPTITATTIYYVAINNGTCESLRTAVTATVSGPCNQPPVITTTSVQTVVEGSVTIKITDLLSDPDNNLDLSTLKIVVQPKSGAVAIIDANQNLIIDYKGIAFTGTDELTIEVCDLAGSCVQQKIIITVEGDVIVYNGFSPNGDLQNSIFEIKNIELLEDTKNNRVSIYNRWGSKVFEVENYNNTTRVFTGLNENGSELPSGTYFYKIEYDSGRETQTGYITLKR